jgi:hypothetical protein
MSEIDKIKAQIRLETIAEIRRYLPMCPTLEYFDLVLIGLTAEMAARGEA